MRIETAVVEIVDHCNLKCIHCYGVFEGSGHTDVPGKRTMPLSNYQMCLKHLYNAGVTQLTLSGGEPMLLGNNIIPYLEMARKEKIPHITVVSNGTIHNVEYHDILVLVDKFQISIDGNGETHDKIRGYGNYQRAVQTLTRLAEIDPSKVIVMMSLHSENFSHLQYVNNLAAKHNVAFAVEIVTACGRGSNIRTLDLKQLEELQKYLISNNINCNDPLSFCVSIPREYFNHDFLAGCAAGVSALCVGTDGTIYPCARLRLPMGNINDGLDGFFLSPIYKNLNNRELLKGKCTDCSNLFICGGCRARAFAKYNDYMAEDPCCITFQNKQHEIKTL